MKEFFEKVKKFIAEWAIEIGFAVLGLVLLFVPFNPYPLKAFGFGMFFASVLNPFIKYIVEKNKK